MTASRFVYCPVPTDRRFGSPCRCSKPAGLLGSKMGNRDIPQLANRHLAPSPLLGAPARSEEHTSELQSQSNLVCRLLLEKKKVTTSSPPIVPEKSACTQFFHQ